MKDDVFLKLYKNLNSEQKKAVDTIEGPVMVIAGPGTGKTSVLTLRIANILRSTDTPPNGILALTFTESAVHSMRRKLFDLIGPAAYRVHIYTFHGFAQEIITLYPEYFPRIIGGIIATDSERFEILEESLTKGDFTLIRPFGDQFFYVRKAIGAIQDIKRDGIDPKSFRDLLTEEENRILTSEDLYHEKGRSKGSMKREYADLLRANEKNKELAVLYALYETSLAERGLYDYDDLLLELVRALKAKKDLLLTLREEYLYILADEHQDANNSQNAILELISDYRDTRNLFIVGDEKQAIYRFQGASLANFLYFQKKFPDSVVIYLDHNYRSTQRILDASHAMMTIEKSLLPRPQLLSKGAVTDHEQGMMHATYRNTDDELLGIAESIRHSIDTGTSPEEIAILVRTNREIESVGRALIGFDVPHTLFNDDDVLKDTDIAKFLILLRAIVYPENDTYVGSMFLVDFLGLNPVDAIRLNREAFETRQSPLVVLSNTLFRSSLNNPDSVAHLAHEFIYWIKIAHNESVVDAFLRIVEGSKFQEYVLGRKQSLEKIEKLTKLFDEVKSFLSTHKDAKLKDFIMSLDTLLRHGTPIAFSKKSLGSKGVTVMTAHKSKGLEWKHVYIPNTVYGVWGSRRKMAGFSLPYPLGSHDEDADEADERRLFYVALTRAKERVYLSHAMRDNAGKERTVSQFVTELPSELVVEIIGNEFTSGESLLKALKEEVSVSRTLFDTDYLRELFVHQGLNPTALNAYLSCPWRYFFKNLVRLPDIPEKYLHFGNAMHASLRMYADKRYEKVIPSTEDVLSVFEADLIRRPLSKKDLSDSLKKGKEILPLYIAEYTDSWHTESITEFAVSGVSLPTEDGEVLLRGRIDKIELQPDGTVYVVDYKTGKRKTRNEILGDTKNSNGDMKRQLDFYKLLLDLHDDGKFRMTHGTIDFVEPDAHGVFHRELFEIELHDVDTLKKVIAQVAHEIYTFSFWNTQCDDKDCEYCTLRNTLLK